MFNFNLSVNKERVNYDVMYDFIALGLGPAGLNAGLYAGRKGLKTLVVGDEIGGQLKNTTDVDNYLGFSNIDAANLIQNFTTHLEALDIPLLTGVRIVKIEKKDDIFRIYLNNGHTLKTKTLLYALGGNPRKLEVPGENEFAGRGLSYCVTCDGPFYKDRDVVVIGGGNSAVDAALDLARIARNVTIIQRSILRADKKSIEKLATYPNISIMLETKVLEFIGNDQLEALKILDTKSHEIKHFKTDAAFVEIGNVPNTSFVADFLLLNEKGEIVVNNRQETNIEGLYAAGDVTSNSHRQIIIAASEGAKAALEAANYINKN